MKLTSFSLVKQACVVLVMASSVLAQGDPITSRDEHREFLNVRRAEYEQDLANAQDETDKRIARRGLDQVEEESKKVKEGFYDDDHFRSGIDEINKRQNRTPGGASVKLLQVPKSTKYGNVEELAKAINALKAQATSPDEDIDFNLL